ncbi:hypothetical protein GW17_00050156 [Ensete ventricosum]|nr:hypothetical protein GW17_00050156 [Ensete ventricosum]
MTHSIGKEDPVKLVLVHGVDPGVADEVNPALPSEVLQGDALEVELRRVPVLDDDCARDVVLDLPVERDVEGGFPGGDGRKLADEAVQVRRLSDEPPVAEKKTDQDAAEAMKVERGACWEHVLGSPTVALTSWRETLWPRSSFTPSRREAVKSRVFSSSTPPCPSRPCPSSRQGCCFGSSLPLP